MLRFKLSWLPITLTCANSNLALIQTKLGLPWISVLHRLQCTRKQKLLVPRTSFKLAHSRKGRGGGEKGRILEWLECGAHLAPTYKRQKVAIAGHPSLPPPLLLSLTRRSLLYLNRHFYFGSKTQRTTHPLSCIIWSPALEHTSVTSLFHKCFVRLSNPVENENVDVLAFSLTGVTKREYSLNISLQFQVQSVEKKDQLNKGILLDQR